MFIFPNGTARLGVVTLNAGADVSGHQPTVFADEERIHFYFGAIKPPRSSLKEAKSKLGAHPFPMRYHSVPQSPSGTPLALGVVEGLYWLADWQSGEIRVVA